MVADNLILVMVAIQLVLLVLLFIRHDTRRIQNIELNKKLEDVDRQLQRFEQLMRQEMEQSRDVYARQEKEARQELTETIRHFQESTTRQLESMQRKTGDMARENREELTAAMKTFQDGFEKNVHEFNQLQRQKFGDLTSRQEEQVRSAEQRLDRMRELLEQKINEIRHENNVKLEQMRETVDEKLHKTLEHRLGESFKQVSERLEQVHQGLGEMQTLASGVGDLKKVLSNVKTRGVLGEYQLENLLEQLLTKEQYEKNVATIPGSAERVEFAVKMPGRNEGDNPVWLPIDAKFPTEDYQQLLDSYDSGDSNAIDQSRKKLIQRIKGDAKTIREKYVEPPHTTDFAILFLPFEGLYAEVLRLNLFENLQREHRVMIAGPTTISAFLNSLQMGFRTLAIEKRSSEVWHLLGAVKTEFGKFGDVLAKTRKKLDEAGRVIDSAGTRTRVIERKLRDVQEIPHEEVKQILGGEFSEPVEEETDDWPEEE